MKVNIDFDEEYPVFYFHKEGDRWFREDRKVYDIPSPIIVEIEETFRKYNEAQSYLEKIYKEDRLK
jgi:hypothetical protein